MVLLLHGCQQSGMDFAKESGFQAAADAEGFVLVTPRQEMQHQLQRCWRWYDWVAERYAVAEWTPDAANRSG